MLTVLLLNIALRASTMLTVAMVACALSALGGLISQKPTSGYSIANAIDQLSFVSSAHAKKRSRRFRRRMMRPSRWRKRHQARRHEMKMRRQRPSRPNTISRSKTPSKAAKPGPKSINTSRTASKPPASQKSVPSKVSQRKSQSEVSEKATGRSSTSSKRKAKPAQSLSDVLKQPSGTVVGLAKQLFGTLKSTQQPKLNQKVLSGRRKVSRKRLMPANTMVRKALKARPKRKAQAALPISSQSSVAPNSKAKVSAKTPPSVRKRRGPIPRLPWAAQGPDLRQVPATVPGELLVANITPSFVEQAERLGITVDQSRVALGSDTTLTRITFAKGQNTSTVVGLLNQFVSGGQIFPNHQYHYYGPATGQARGGWKTSIETESRGACTSSDCYGASVIGWNDKLARCAMGRRIGVIDSAIDRNHAAFAAGRIQTRRLHSGPVTGDADGHGTGVLAILAGGPSSDTPGLVPAADFYHVDAFFRSKGGALTSDTLSLVKALDILRRWRAEVVNLSLVGPKDALLERALRKLTDQGAIVVSAAGNGGPGGGTSYPAGYDNVIAVMAIDKNRKAYAYANRGAFIDVAAPGVNIWTALPGQNQGLKSGTSFAVPFATAVVAALYTALPNTDRLSVLARLPTIDLGRAGKDAIYGAGLIQAPQSCLDVPVANSIGRGSQFASLGVNERQKLNRKRFDFGWQRKAFFQQD